MSSMPHIVHVIFSLENGGAENMLVDIVNEQVAYARVSLVIVKDLIHEPLLMTVDPRVTLKLLHLDPKRYSKAGLFLKLQVLLSQLRPAIVHLHQETTTPFFPRWFRTRPYQVFLTVHDTGIRLPRSVANVDTVFAISQSVVHDLQNRHQLASRLNYNGVCVEEIATKRSYALGSRIRVVQISRLLHTKKGQHILLQAAATLIHQYQLPLEVDIIGDGPSQGHLEELVRQLRIEAHVHFAGSLPKREIYAKLHTYDILVQPSLYEGFGLTVVEGMIAGLPVLVSDIEGPMEIVRGGEYGFAFERGNAQQCAQSLLDIIERYRTGRIQELTLKASQYARSQFDIRRTAHDYACQATQPWPALVKVG